MITIVDYGLGNAGSIANMLSRLGHPALISADPDAVRSADKLILPGVGAFDHGMAGLERSGLRAALEQRVLRDRVPLLGICLGLQLLTAGSEEGSRPGLGWVDAATRAFRGRVDGGLKVPHMGWNTVAPLRACPLDFDGASRFYFVHSYFVECADPSLACGQTEYGLPFTAVLCAGNIMGVQFHPEKSHRFGMRLLDSFARRA